MKPNAFSISILFFLLFIGGLSNLFAQTFDISSGGAPTITGAIGGSVTGNSSITSDLSVTVNFGEVSPVNTHNFIKVIVPIAIRSTADYEVNVTITGSTSANLQGIQASDVGFGVDNLRAMGNRSQTCNHSSHIFYSPFDNDPVTAMTIGPTGRVAYTSALDDIVGGVTILSGPDLSQGNAKRATNNGYIFDAIFVLTPQFYAESSGSATITFSISAGPSVPC